MKVQFIYTFNGKKKREQVITDYNCLLPGFLETKNVFLSWAMTCLDTEEEMQELVKVSCCIDGEGKKMPDCPKWYDDMNGKFWLDDIETWRKENGVKSTVPAAYIKEWMNENA